MKTPKRRYRQSSATSRPVMKRSDLGSFLTAIQNIEPKYKPDPDLLTISQLQQSGEFCQAVRTLRDFGYSVAESVALVRKNGVSAAAEQVKAAVLAVLSADLESPAPQRGRPRKNPGSKPARKTRVPSEVKPMVETRVLVPVVPQVPAVATPTPAAVLATPLNVPLAEPMKASTHKSSSALREDLV